MRAETVTIAGRDGLYSVSQAARLTELNPSRLRRWVLGYRWGEGGESPPLVVRDATGDDLTFADLIEVLFVRAFLDQGCSMRTIRRAADVARELFNHPRPFSLKKLETDGYRIFTRISPDAASEDKEALLELAKNQHVFAQVVRPHIRKLDYEDDIAARWWPMGHGQPIVVDPKRQFGQPIVAKAAVPTRVLYGAASAGESVPDIANWYSVTVPEVEAALRFEAHLQGPQRRAA
jgi:uncharacterized protein (DUF433 family)/DNA-binding transcriptional MerR regulator